MPFCFSYFVSLFVCFRCHLLKVVALKKAGYNKKRGERNKDGSNGILLCNIMHDAIHGLPRCLYKSFPPHELIQVAGYFFRSTPPHPFELHFCVVPVGPCILRVDSRWAHKFHGVIDFSMGRYIWKIAHLVVTGPLV